MDDETKELEVEELLPMWVDETGMLIDTMDLMSVTAKPRLFANQITPAESKSYLTEGLEDFI